MIEQPPPTRSEGAQKLASKLQARVRKTENPDRLTKGELAIGRLLYPEPIEWRPRTRADCDKVPRPCPYVGCRHHLAIEVGRGGSIMYAQAPVEPADLAYSCSLDLAEADGLMLDQVAQALGVTRERVRQLEERALEKARRAAARLGLDLATMLPDLAEGFPSP